MPNFSVILEINFSFRVSDWWLNILSRFAQYFFGSFTGIWGSIKNPMESAASAPSPFSKPRFIEMISFWLKLILSEDVALLCIHFHRLNRCNRGAGLRHLGFLVHLSSSKCFEGPPQHKAGEKGHGKRM